MATAKAYDVVIERNGGELLVDTVWFTGYTEDEARRSLIEHAGYSPEITVREHDPRELPMADASPATVDRITGRNR